MVKQSISKAFESRYAALVFLALLVALRIWNPWIMDVFTLKSTDIVLNSASKTVSTDIVIVDIDEASTDKYGQWPFDRRDLATIINKLRAEGAGVIMVPILLSEPDRAKGDDEFAKAINAKGVVLGQVGTVQTRKPTAVPRGFAKVGEGELAEYLFQWPGAISPLAKLGQSANGVGMINTTPEIDGVTRRYPMMVMIQDKPYPSIVLETIRTVTSDPSYQVKMSEGVQAVRVPGFKPIETDANGRIYVQWQHEFPRIALSTNNFKAVKDKIVVLGVTLEGVAPVIATPNGSVYAHDIQAHVLQTVIDGSSPSRPVWTVSLEIAIAVVFALVLWYFLPKVAMITVIPMALVMVGITAGAPFAVFNTFNILLDPVWPTIATLSCLGYILFVNYARQFRLRQQIKKQFGTYLTPALVEKLQKNPELLQLGGDERELSIMFTDVRGFTTISEHYGKDVQGLTKIMNRYMTAMTSKILENNGTLDKYIGDAQMAFWNAPVDEPRHAHQAVKTALEMMESLDAFNREIAAEGVPAFGMGLGINTAAVVVGNMGSDQRFDYTCLGDGVNLASRLEGQSKPYGVKIVLGQRTAELVQDEYPVVELDCIAVKGKNIGIKIFTIGTTVVTDHNNYLEAYYRGDWTRALRIAKKLAASETSIKDYYLAMIQRLEDGLPANWDGVYRATSK